MSRIIFRSSFDHKIRKNIVKFALLLSIYKLNFKVISLEYILV